MAGGGAQPLISISSINNPRIADTKAILDQILTGVDQKTVVEYDDTLNSTLQTAQNYRKAKVANTVSTAAGSNVTAQSQQGVAVTFSNVLQAGVTITTPTDPGTATGVPGGFVLTPQIAFD